MSSIFCPTIAVSLKIVLDCLNVPTDSIGMIVKTTLRSGHLRKSLTLESIRNFPVEGGGDVTAFFATAAERDGFLALLPKYVKARPCDLGCHHDDVRGVNSYGLVWYAAPHGSVSYGVYMYVGSPKRLYGVTGAVNETGLKRWARFVKVLELLEVVEDLN